MPPCGEKYTEDRISVTSVPLIEPAHIVALPKGQPFALLAGGHLWKIRMPLPAPDPDEVMLKDLQTPAAYMAALCRRERMVERTRTIAAVAG